MLASVVTSPRPHPPTAAWDGCYAVPDAGRCLEGLEDAAEWRGLAALRQSLLARALRLCGGNRADAEDLVSCAMIRAVEVRRQGGPAAETPLPWLERVMRNLNVDRYRRRLVAAQAGGDPAFPGPVEPLSAEARLLQRGDEALALAALASLPPPLRDAIELRVLQELGYAEVARRLGIAEPAARKRVQLARARLRDAARRLGAG